MSYVLQSHFQTIILSLTDTPHTSFSLSLSLQNYFEASHPSPPYPKQNLF